MGLPRMSRRLNERAGARALPRLPNRRVGRVGGRMRGGRHGKGVRAGGGIAQVAGDVIRLPRASQNVLEAGGARPAPPPPPPSRASRCAVAKGLEPVGRRARNRGAGRQPPSLLSAPVSVS